MPTAGAQLKASVLGTGETAKRIKTARKQITAQLQANQLSSRATPDNVKLPCWYSAFINPAMDYALPGTPHLPL